MAKKNLKNISFMKKRKVFEYKIKETTNCIKVEKKGVKEMEVFSPYDVVGKRGVTLYNGKNINIPILRKKCFYSNQSAFGKMCKIIFDGSHYVATEKITRDKKRVFYKKEDEYEQEKKVIKGVLEEAVKQDLKEKAIKQYLLDIVQEIYPNMEKELIKNLVEEVIYKREKNKYLRLKRLINKGYLNKWNYFITFTYDDKKHTEESFRQALKKCLSNLAYRRKYKYMGVFERSPEEKRLHFHAIMYIPDGEMIGELKTRKDYSIKKHRMQITTYNTFFEKKFGRSDFEEINKQGLIKAVEYLTKYMDKTGEQIMYSRGLKSELVEYVDNNDIACKYESILTRYVLFDDCIVDNVYRPYKPPKLKQETMFEIPEKEFKINKNLRVYRFYKGVKEHNKSLIDFAQANLIM